MEAQTRKYYSNHRSSYRRKNEPEPKRDYREVLLMQCIISGIMLVVVLFISIIHLPMTTDLRVSLKSAFSQNTKFEEVLNASSDFDAVFVDMKDSVKTIFGGTEAESDIPASVPAAVSAPEPEQAPLVNDDFRIDEDILQEINEKADFYGEAEKKPIVPTMQTTAPEEPAQ